MPSLIEYDKPDTNPKTCTLEGDPRKLFQSWKKCDCPYKTVFFFKFPWCSQIGISYDGYKIDMAIWRRVFCPLPKNPTFIKLPGNFYKMCFVGTVALFSLWTKSFRGDQNLDPSWQFFGFIRTCQNPIGRASTKNWKLWLFHIKWRVGKKVTNYVFLFYKDLSSSY